MNNEVENFLEMLERSGLISREDFASLSRNQTPEEIFEALELVNTSNLKLTQVYAKFRDIPFVQITSIDQEALDLLGEDLAKKFGFVPFFIDETNKILQVAITDPQSYLALNQESLKTLGEKIGYKIEIMMASREQVYRALNDHPMDQNAVEGQDAPQPSLEESLGNENIESSQLKQFSLSDDVVKLVDAIIALALDDRASDVHIEPFEKVIRVRLRVDGEMEDVIALPAFQLRGIVSRLKVLAKLRVEEERLPQDGRFDVLYKQHPVDIRVSTLPTIFGEKISLRLLPKNKHMISLEALGLDGLGQDYLTKAVHLPYGLVIVTGPNGSGKTTTIYSLLSSLDKSEVDIITLEDAVEYELPRVNQVKLGPHLGFGYAEGIRSVLKQDPDIIFIGEISDRETSELAIQGALSGRVVLTTLHANNASQALPRLLNMGVDSFLLSSALKAVTAQRLVRRLCPSCKEEAEISPAMLSSIKKELEGLNINLPFNFYKAKGCPKCKNGYLGRIGIFEVLPIKGKVEEMLINKMPASEIETAAKADGFITMRQDGFIKSIKGLTSVDEVIRSTSLGE